MSKIRWSRIVLVGCLATALLGPGAAAGAKKPKAKRWEIVLNGTYTGFSGVNAASTNACNPVNNYGCAVFEVPEGAGFARVELVDSAAPAVAAYVDQDANRDQQLDGSGTDVCSSMDEPLRVGGAGQLVVMISQGPCSDATPAAATTGTVTVTFSNLP